jgi:hypothetical protein
MPIPISLLCMLIAWALVTIALLVVVTYRGFLGKDETDRIYVNQAQSRLAMQQQEIITKVSRLDKFVKGLLVASGGLLVLSLAVWVWSSFANL